MTSLFYALAVLAQRGAWFLFLPPYSPDLNPVEMASASSRMLRSAFAKAAADKHELLTRRSFSVGGQAQHEG
jgi:transposase